MVCVVCRVEPAAVGLLCEGCRGDVAAPLGLLPQQILATVARPTDDGLVDQWGQPHRLETSTLIGRTLEGLGIILLEASVSRHHARIERSAGGWMLRDLGSANGTFLNEGQLTEPALLSHGDRIEIGCVGFYFVAGLGDAAPIAVDPAVITTVQAVDRLRAKHNDVVTGEFSQVDETFAGLPRMPIRIVEPTGGGGGVLEIGEISVQLSMNQVELLTVLVRRMQEEAHQSERVRGFVRSSELLATLSWDTREPDDNHIKQLVRRARRQMVRAGLGDLIESRQRFGYRLRAIPET